VERSTASSKENVSELIQDNPDVNLIWLPDHDFKYCVELCELDAVLSNAVNASSSNSTTLVIGELLTTY